MPDKACPQCGETVDEAKAFCPACGHAFIEEETRTDTSAYESADHTMQMGQTMYNNMLSDMGLNIKRAEGTTSPEKRVEVLKPVGAKPAHSPHPAAPQKTTPVPQAQAEPIRDRSNKKVWIIAIIAALALLGIIAVAIVGVAVYLYLRAGRV